MNTGRIRLALVTTLLACASKHTESNSESSSNTSAGSTAEVSTGAGEPTTGGQSTGCTRRDPLATSPPSFRWSLACGTGAHERTPVAAVTASGDLVIVITVGVSTEPPGTYTFNVGGDDFVNRGDDDLVVARFDGAGNHVWSQFWANSGFQGAYEIAALPDDGVAIAFHPDGALEVGGEPITTGDWNDEVIVALTADGSYRWHRTLAGSGGPEDNSWTATFDLDASADGTLAVAVGIQGSVMLDGDGPFGSPDVDTSLLALMEADGSLRRATVRMSHADMVAIAGDGSVVVGLDDGIERLDNTGASLWTRTGWGNIHNNQSIAIAPDGDIVVAGGFTDQVDLGGGPLVNGDYDFEFGNDSIYVARFDVEGNHRWSLQRDDPDGFFVAELSIGAHGEAYVFYGFPEHANTPSRVEVFDTAGITLALLQLSALEVSAGGHTNDGAVYIAGSSRWPADLGGGGVPVINDSRDVWIGRLVPDTGLDL